MLFSIKFVVKDDAKVFYVIFFTNSMTVNSDIKYGSITLWFYLS